MTDREKDFLILHWNLFEKGTRLKIVTEFLKLRRTKKISTGWWQFLEKKINRRHPIVTVQNNSAGKTL